MATHLEENLQRDADRICANVARMSQLASRALEDCVKAFVEDNRQLAYAVILRDQYIDAKEKEVDQLCLEFLVRQQPVGLLLRFAYATIKVNLEIERVGDYAESIARHLLKINARPTPEVISGIAELARISTLMFRNSVKAFLARDVELAKQAIASEESADLLKRKLNGDLVKLFRQQQLSFDDLHPLTTVVRRFERVSDQGRNICMETLYMCTGEQKKHPGADGFRVLFVDEHNSCRSQMAEAIAQVLNPPRFVFTSAGLEPQPIDPRTVEFMKGKGVDLSMKVPEAVFQVPNLDHHHVIVALAPEVHRAFPQRPRKVVFLDWPVPDPSAAAGSSEEIHAAYEKTYAFLQSHIHDLIEAIVETQPESKEKP